MPVSFSPARSQNPAGTLTVRTSKETDRSGFVFAAGSGSAEAGSSRGTGMSGRSPATAGSANIVRVIANTVRICMRHLRERDVTGGG